jgi:hemolysin activation/secretion protein
MLSMSYKSHCPLLALTITLVSVGTLLSFVHMRAEAAPPSGTAIDASANPGQFLSSPSALDYDNRRRRELAPQDAAQDAKFDFGKQQAQIGLESTTFFVNDVTFEGNTLVDTATLSNLATPFKGKQTNLDELTKLVDAVNQVYWDKGYLTTQAVIPPQDVSYGALKVQVYEGKLGKLNIEGNKYTRSNVIMNQLDLKEGDIINFRDLEKNLNRVNTQNRYNVKASLAPGSQTGETDVTMKVADPNPWQITPTFDNQGRPFIGYYRTGVELSNYNLTGRGDRVQVGVNRSEGATGVLGSYVTPVGKYGTEVGVLGGFSNVRLDLPGGVVGQAYNASLYAQQPLNKRRTMLLDLAANYKHIHSDVSDTRVSTDEIRSATLGFSFNEFDRYGRTYGRIANTVGAEVLGGNWGFYKAEGYATRLFTLPYDNLIILRGSAQYSPTDLPSAEGYAVGGAYSVRGYTEGLLIGDSGYTFSAEHRWPIPGLKSLSPWWHDRVRGAFFFDIGQAFLDNDNVRFVSNNAQNTLLIGAGAGLRVSLSQFLTGFLDVGFPLVDRETIEPNSQATARIHFGIRSELIRDGQYSNGLQKF